MAWNASTGTAKPVQSPKGGKSNWKLPLTGIVLIAAIVSVFVAVNDGGFDESEDGPASALQKPNVARDPRAAVNDVMKRVAAPANGKVRAAKPKLFAFVERLSGEDLAMAESLQAALDDGDFKKVLASATRAMTSTNGEVRLNAVEALGWFGAQALPELAGAMADSNEDVRQAAENNFELGLQEIEKPGDQFNVAMAAFGTLMDEDQLISLGGILGNAAAELIDNEEDQEKQSANRVAVVQAIADIIENENAAPQNVAAAKELYNDITCNEWQGIEEAERYLADPDNYDPDAKPE